MDLSDIYTGQVQKKSVELTGSLGNFITRERDPKLQSLENKVNSKMNQAIKPHDLKPTPKQEKTVYTVDLEQALKELLNSSESIDNKL